MQIENPIVIGAECSSARVADRCAACEASLYEGYPAYKDEFGNLYCENCAEEGDTEVIVECESIPSGYHYLTA
jgi:hypothetical protein